MLCTLGNYILVNNHQNIFTSGLSQWTLAPQSTHIVDKLFNEHTNCTAMQTSNLAYYLARTFKKYCTSAKINYHNTKILIDEHKEMN